MTYETTIMRLAAIGFSGVLLTGCVMAEKYEAEKSRSLNFQRLLAQEEKRTGDLDAELKHVKLQASELEARNREMTAQIQAVREQLASIQEEAAAARETEGMRAQMKGGSKSKKAKRQAKTDQAAVAPAPVAADPIPAQAGSSPAVHVVQAGETVYRIARQNGVSVQQIRQWNNLKNDVIEVGQQLVVAPPQP
ncbi:MAG: LysM peptidoglycan-binding domain-containing protein [Nitrospirae bacterium]|nr:LysM peptidoglycan-binding domain-containing protein [Candidatus Uhrbacteria bacterium]MBI5776385.1 LysM peptidoglycan-binding domain-containing protein [Nitrospirota bacterium]